PDGRKLAMNCLAGNDEPRDNRVWSLGDGGSLDLSTSTSAAGVEFSPDSRRLVVTDNTGMIRFWDLEQRAEIERFSAQALSAQLLPEGRIFSAGLDNKIRIGQARRPGVLQLKGYPNSLRTLAFSPDNRWLVSAGLDYRVFVWNMQGDLAGVYTNH